MKPNRVLLGSVLVAALALTSTSARAEEVIAKAPVGGCTNCGGDGSPCAGCGDPKPHWHPGQAIANLHDCASAKIHSLADCFHHPKPVYAPPPIPPQYMYNPYNRSPRDYFMSQGYSQIQAK